MKRGLVLDLNTTSSCNLNCTYCFEGTKKSSAFKDVSSLKSFIDRLLSVSWFQKEYGSIKIMFFGGEPTLNIGFIKELIYTYIDNPAINYGMYSNGVYFPKEFREIIKLCQQVSSDKFNIQISYDGAVLQDKCRVDFSGKGSNDIVLNTLKTLDEEGITYVIKPTISPKDFKELFQAYLDITAINNLNYHPTIDNNIDFDDDEYKDYGDDLRIALMDIASYELKHNIYPTRFNGFRPSKAYCSAGVSGVAIDTNGTILPCHGLLWSEDKQHLIANIKDEDAVEKLKANIDYFKSFFTKQPEKCKNCPSTFCMRCNARKYELSNLDSYEDKWTDHTNQEYLCYYFDIISEVKRAYDHIRSANVYS